MPRHIKETAIECKETMNSREFFYLVAQMRSAQKEYFKSREQLALRAARKLEIEVDKEIERVRAIVENSGG